jgi:hypothetical protein
MDGVVKEDAEVRRDEGEPCDNNPNDDKLYDNYGDNSYDNVRDNSAHDNDALAGGE